MQIDTDVMDKDEALALCFAYLKGPKDKPIPQLVKALEYLRALPEFNSNTKVGEAVGVSAEIVREFLTIGKLPVSVRNQVRSLEQGRRLWQLGKHRPEILEEAARELSSLRTHDLRHTVDYLIRNSSSSVLEAKEKVLSSKTITRHVFHVVAELEESDYETLRAAARQRKQNVNDLVTTIVLGWLRQS